MISKLQEITEMKTVQDASNILKCTTKTIYRKLKTGDIKGIKYNNKWQITPDELISYVNRGTSNE